MRPAPAPQMPAPPILAKLIPVRLIPVTLILALVAAPLMADPPDDAAPIDAAQALACVAARYRGEALRIADEDDARVHQIRWLTPAGNVLHIEVTGPGCRFLAVDGVGQSEARLLPGAPR